MHNHEAYLNRRIKEYRDFLDMIETALQNGEITPSESINQVNYCNQRIIEMEAELSRIAVDQEVLRRYFS